MNAKHLCGLSLLVALSACPPMQQDCVTGNEPVCDLDASLPPDFCNSLSEALSDGTNCLLTVNDATGMTRKENVFISRLEDGGVDKDWYLAPMPTLTPRSLLHVNAGYQAPQTAVNFTLNVLNTLADGGTTSIATGVDRHGAGAPKPVDLVVPFGQSNAKLVLLVGDEGSGTNHVDNRNPYSILVQVLDNPDTHEPNDATPTPITLTAAGAEQQGMSSGYLATNDDVDVYSFQVTSASRQIIYLHITDPVPHPTNPPPAFGRLTYTLFDPMNTAISEGTMGNEFQPIDLATARLVPMTGTYTVKISGYKPPNSTAVVPGDLRVQYTVAIRLLPDLDPQEPNDTFATAKPVAMSPNSTTTLTGKLSYVADEEWFALRLPARSSPSVLRYKATVAAAAGRYAPTSKVASRQVRLIEQVTTGTTSQDRQVACLTNPTACPRSFTDPLSNAGMLIKSLCQVSDPPQCLYSERDEETMHHANLTNFVGAIPVAPNAATDVYLVFRDQGQGGIKYADDRDWTIEVQWNDDADEASRVGGPTVVNLGGGTTTSTGVISFGYGRTLDPFDINRGDGIRGPEDYDAFDTDRDLFQFNVSGTGDQSWALQWELGHADGGSAAPGELGLDLIFCNGTGTPADGGFCVGQQERIFAYSDQVLAPWYSPSMDLAHSFLLIDKQNTLTSTVFTVKPAACTCLSGPRTAAGRFFINVLGINRVSNDPIQYTLRQSINPYPSATNFPGLDGGPTTCPVVDAGCGFAK